MRYKGSKSQYFVLGSKPRFVVGKKRWEAFDYIRRGPGYYFHRKGDRASKHFVERVDVGALGGVKIIYG